MLVGTSLYENCLAAQKAGMLSFDMSTVGDDTALNEYDDDEVLVVCTGSQVGWRIRQGTGM